jgi:succinate dehydrogenase flavin-adding protein (antitoxin of CptAB toxin-antitoxin module)
VDDRDLRRRRWRCRRGMKELDILLLRWLDRASGHNSQHGVAAASRQPDEPTSERAFEPASGQAAERASEQATAQEWSAFDQILALPDPQLARHLLGGEPFSGPPDSGDPSTAQVAALLERIRNLPP